MGSSKTNTIPEGVKNVDSKESLENSKKEKVGKSQTTEEIINEPEVVKEIIEEKVESVDIDHSEWNALLKKNVSNTGNVNYRGFIRDKAMLENYLNTLATKIPDETWSKNAKLAYWINVYNAFTVKLIVDNYPIKSIKDISNPWEKKFFTLEGSNYSLEQVENEILRKMNEPRIHFAINCASYSCPNLANQAYTSNTMERQLTDASKKFINDSSKNNISENEIKISEIFNWFSKDFKNTNTSVIDFLNKYSATKISNEAKVSYLDYNWSLNE
ncbi:DUF547 domain-containing protein [Flavobacterium jejuense]|uniref:DUF547 domain-containing protein n=2 Tax=Flavobacterium jejuense TaxID=1544455 RepID=A0ABX0IUS6_9FLAO|nr:DUF547 domain-containing protein [Flavobacterium jejuense]